MSKPAVLITAWLPDGLVPWLVREFPEVEFVEAREDKEAEPHLPQAAVIYGLPPAEGLEGAPQLRWIQLISAGVPQELCEAARGRSLSVTNLAGLYGPSIAEHALALLAMVARNLQLAVRNQEQAHWDRDLACTMVDLHGQTLAVVGLGNIGQSIARLARGWGMRIIGCRRTGRPTPHVDHVYPLAELHALLAEADLVTVAAPLTRHTEGMLGPDEFRALKPGAIYINVSRGGIAQEPALLEALRTGRVRAAGLDVFAVEPLPAGHPFWSMPQVVISPHCSGETVNRSVLPAQRFARNLRSWLAGRPLEGVVNLEWGY
jgi:D-2-hydroxyacid dehydrogenase (NADP+)